MVHKHYQDSLKIGRMSGDPLSMQIEGYKWMGARRKASESFDKQRVEMLREDNFRVSFVDEVAAVSAELYEKYRVGEKWALIKDNKKTMNLTSMMKRLLDADTQTLVKAGYIDSNLEMTTAGHYALEAILFDANKAALVAAAQARLVEAAATK